MNDDSVVSSNVATHLLFVIYDVGDIFYNDQQWFLSSFFATELKYLHTLFKENVDLITYRRWSNNSGYDVLISQKAFTWLCLRYDAPLHETLTSYNNMNSIIDDLTQCIQSNLKT